MHTFDNLILLKGSMIEDETREELQKDSSHILFLHDCRLYHSSCSFGTISALTDPQQEEDYCVCTVCMQPLSSLTGTESFCNKRVDMARCRQ